VGGLALLATLNYLEVPWVWQLGDYIPKELCSSLDGLLPGLVRVFAHEVSGTYSVVSRRVIDESRSDGLGLNGRIELIPYWITGDRPAARSRFFSPGQTLRIIAVGRVDAQKGVDILIDTAAQLQAEGIEGYTIDVYGRIVDSTFPGMIGSLGLEGIVRFQGSRPHEQILKLYSEYDLLLFPTHAREPFGLVPIEAMAQGCVPLISADCGVGEWLVHGVHCLKAARTSQAFARVLRQIIRGDLDLEPLARRGESVVWRAFHIDTVLPRIEALLLDAAGTSTDNQTVVSRRPTRAAEAYRLARMAEQLTQAMIQEACLD
jgi:glycosyltransferase involved in cell wall biosynthesis